jgi:hypothetical protein
VTNEAIVAAATVVLAVSAVLYTVVTRGLWKATRRQAGIAEKQADTTQQMLDAAHRPYVSVELFPDIGTGPDVINWASVFHNYGTVPATLTKATARATFGAEVLAEGDQLRPNQVPSQLCIFPTRENELTWGVGKTSAAPWPKSGYFRISVEIEYRGVFENRTYVTRLEASYPRPDGTLTHRATVQMQIVRAEAT